MVPKGRSCAQEHRLGAKVTRDGAGAAANGLCQPRPSSGTRASRWSGAGGSLPVPAAPGSCQVEGAAAGCIGNQTKEENPRGSVENGIQ